MNESHSNRHYVDAMKKLAGNTSSPELLNDVRYDLISLLTSIEDRNQAAEVARLMCMVLSRVADDDVFYSWAEAICRAKELLSPTEIHGVSHVIASRIRTRSPNGYCISKMCLCIANLANQIEIATIREATLVLCEYVELETGLYWNLLDHLHVLEELSRSLSPDAVDHICSTLVRRIKRDENLDNRKLLQATLARLTEKASSSHTSMLSSD